MDLGLKGKHAVVTGGSRGIGRGIALTLADQGVSVAACYSRESDAVSSLAAELERKNNDSHVAQVDVADEASVNRLAGTIKDRFRTVEILVNNAGVVSHKPLAQLDLAEWRRVIDTNLTGMFLVVKALMDMIPQGGSIINVGSAVAMVGMVGRVHYTASKSGVIGFTRSLCKELGPRGIRANGIAPGIIETDQATGLTPEQRTRYANLAALQRLGQSDDIAGAALFLASDLSKFVSGVVINVDGGI
jgi:NAD(P)-dependent dehydrogenase (short-subunit alcohol dehydrogenase family)